MTREQKVATVLVHSKLTVAVAESCTGGLLSHVLTNTPGSSEYFCGGVVSYTNEAKERLLGVKRNTLTMYGAVSEETAREMARGARRIFTTDIALAITGIAGPTGGSPQKPVGLTYIALSTTNSEKCERHVWRGNRWENKTRSVNAALRLLSHYLYTKRVRRT